MGVEDIDPGDETHRHGDYVKAQHNFTDLASAPEEGDAMTIDASGNAVQAEAGDPIVGMLCTVPEYETPDGPILKEDGYVTLKARGSAKARVDAAVDGGVNLGTAAADAGAFGTNEEQGYVTLGESFTEDGTEYVDLLLR
jgi:hypothetical protein